MQQTCIFAALTLDDEFPYVFRIRFVDVTAPGAHAIKAADAILPHRPETEDPPCAGRRCSPPSVPPR
jgi:hypothetical protein